MQIRIKKGGAKDQQKKIIKFQEFIQKITNTDLFI